MGLPIFGISNYSNPQWIPEPNGRGTWGLVQTCLLTLGLCVYSAIHLNVFHRECRWWTRWLVRCKWLVVALLAPEFVVFNAWSQRRQAVRIARMLQRRYGQEVETTSRIATLAAFLWAPRARMFDPESSKIQENRQAESRSKRLDQEGGLSQKAQQNQIKPETQEQEKAQNPGATTDSIGVPVKAESTSTAMDEKFDVMHGFVIVMGGIVIDMSRDKQRVWPKGCDSLTITPACFEECFERDVFRDIDLGFLTREKIKGKQKVDQLAKSLIIVQALWFCFQFVARIWQSLPVSLLELNTFAHSLCALFIYVLWWYKPGDIDDPFVIHTDESEALRDLCAAQWTSGAVGKYYERQDICKGSRTRQIPTWTPIFVHGGSELSMNIFRGRRGITLGPGSGEDWYIFDHVNRWFYFPHLQKTDPFALRVRGVDHTDVSRVEAGELIPGTAMRLAPQFGSLVFDKITLERWRRTFQHDELSRNYTVWLRDRQPNFAWPRGLDDSVDGPRIAEELLKAMFMLLITSMCYGGLHMLAWQSGVLRKTGPDQVFWKLSCLLLMALGPFALSVWAGLKTWRGADAHLRLNQTMSIAFGAFGAVAFLAYVMSRVYLLVEIILVIPYMDPGVYQEPSFPSYWPHFG